MRIGLGLSAVVVVAVIAYLQLKAMTATPPQSIGQLLLAISVADMGQFISGVAGALAFLWLVLAYRQQNHQLEMQQQELKLQRRELALQRAETKRLADEAQAQVEVLKQTRAGAARDAFVRALDLYERQLAQQAAFIYDLYIRQHDSHVAIEYRGAWAEYERGDRDVFFKRLIALVAKNQHDRFLRIIDKYVFGQGRDAMRKYCEMAAAAVVHAEQVDEAMVRVCKQSQWHLLALGYDQVLGGVPVAALTNM